MHLDAPRPAGLLHETHLVAGEHTVLVRLYRHRRARRYVLRLRHDGTARITVPRGGDVLQGLHFAGKHSQWLEKQLVHRALHPPLARTWDVGSRILFRGEPVLIEPAESTSRAVRFASEIVRLKAGVTDVRPRVERHLWSLAKLELPLRVMELAAMHAFTVSRVSVRNQRSRWGSCSRRGTISLNWRLIQAPGFVRDYIICHELAHLRHMNHSTRFWSEVARLCPGFENAEKWLKQNSALLR
jgi:predicted metal-dependent hydrolase